MTGMRGRIAQLPWVVVVVELLLLVPSAEEGFVAEGVAVDVMVPFKRSAFRIAAARFSGDDSFALITMTFPSAHDPGKVSYTHIVVFTFAPPIGTVKSAVAFPPGRKPESKPLIVVFVFEIKMHG